MTTKSLTTALNWSLTHLYWVSVRLGKGIVCAEMTELSAGVVGVRAAATHIELMPLALMEWWEARHVRVHGREIDAIWDVSGAKYGRGAGLHVWVDGKHAGHAPPVHDVTAGAHDATGLPRLVAPRVRISLDRRHWSELCVWSLSGRSPSQSMGRRPASTAHRSLLRNGPHIRNRYDGSFATMSSATSDEVVLRGAYSQSAGRVTS